MQIEKQELLEHSLLVREAGKIVYTNKTFSHLSMGIFPRGWCGVLSRVLGTWLLSKYPNEVFYYISGFKYAYLGLEMSHAWIKYENLIIDITADQFENISEPVIILKESESAFHKSFAEYIKRKVTLTDINYTEEREIFNTAKTLEKYKKTDV